MEHIESKVTQVADYYPFGMQIKQSSTDVTNPLANKYLYQGKELQAETETYDFHARGYDPALGRTWQIDPHSENYLNLSPYSWVANNPLLFTDPTGMDIDLGNLYDKDEDGNYLYQRQILAFELFASTKTGKEFLSQRAQEGFEFKGAFVKGLEFKAEQAGDLSSKVDANFKVTDLDSYEATKDLTSGALGLTEAEITDKGKLSVTYHMHSERSDFFQKYGLKSENGAHEILNSVDTWAHETLIHGYAKEQNFFSGKYNGLIGKVPFDGQREHNLRFSRQTPYYRNIENMLKHINKGLKLGVSEDYIYKKIIFHGYDN